jgi:hypothetical protein
MKPQVYPSAEEALPSMFNDEIWFNESRYGYVGSIMHSQSERIGHFWVIIKHGDELWRHDQKNEQKATRLGPMGEGYQTGEFELSRGAAPCLHLYSIKKDDLQN